ncbi:MAG: TolC family protein [Owenweeksia sp.]
MKPLKFLITALLLSFLGYAQVEDRFFSLEEAQAYALKNSYSVVDRRLELEKAKQTIRETRASGLPQVTASAQYTNNIQIQGQPVKAQVFDASAPPDLIIYAPFGVKNQTVASISVNQLLFDGSYFVALQASKVYEDIANLDVNKSEIEIRSSISTAYYTVLIAREARVLAEENLEVIKKNYSEVKALYDNGFVEEQDVDQLELLSNNVSNQLNNAQRQELYIKQLLMVALGMPLEGDIVLTDSLDDMMELSTNESLLNEAGISVEDHIDYRIVSNNNRAATLQLKNEKAMYLPRVSGFLQHSQLNADDDNFNAFNYNTYWAPGTSIGFGVEWSLFTGLARSARVQKAEIDLDRTEVAMKATNDQIRVNYARARSNYLFALDNLETQKKNMDISRKIRDKTLIKYREGISSSLDLTQAENQNLEAQQNYLNALQNLLNTKEELILAIGK